MAEPQTDADTNTIEGMVEAEVAQELRAEQEPLGVLAQRVKADVEEYVKANPWTGLMAAGIAGAIVALILA
jgi:ElaB/YqjD/DUF883 family membrane-anchored ribosome-binding protein